MQKSTEKNLNPLQNVTVGNQQIRHNGFAKDSIVQQYVQYAYEIGGMELFELIECENGTRDLQKKSEVVGENSFGLCQINQYFHSEIVNDTRFWNDWRWQIEQCNALMKNGTSFYGRERVISGVKCSEYVKERFYFN